MSKRQKWTTPEDAALIGIVTKYENNRKNATIKWDVVAKSLSRQNFQKTAKQCRERWIQQLTPNLSREKWNLEENKKLLTLYKQKQNHWKEISSHLDGRTDNAAKNQFFALMRKGLRKACRTIGLTSNTIKINGLKPKVLLDFFQLKSHFTVKGSTKLINVSEFVEHYALNEIQEDVIDEEQKPLISEIMSYLTNIKWAN